MAPLPPLDPDHEELINGIRIPDVVGEVTGWRAWRLVGTPQLPRLMSVTATQFRVIHEDAIWPTNRWFRAKCPHGHVEEIPVEGCKCGVYAARSREQLIRLGYGVYKDDDNRIVGEVAYAGKVIVGEQGYKGELARIKRLIVPYEKYALVEPLQRAYHVPVEVGFLFADHERGRNRSI